MSQTTAKGHRSQPANKLEGLWDELLSRQPERVQTVYRALEQPEREAVIAHLQRMVAEPGWQPEQRVSAQAAIQALENLAE
jgi:hypothetical protein